MYCIHEMRKMNEWMKPVNECDRDGKIDGCCSSERERRQEKRQDPKVGERRARERENAKMNIEFA